MKRQVIAQPMSAEDFEYRKKEAKRRLEEEVRSTHDPQPAPLTSRP